MNDVKSENRFSYPRLLPSEHRLLLPSSPKCQVIQTLLLWALTAYPFVGWAHGVWDGMKQNTVCLFCKSCVFLSKVWTLRVSESFADCHSPTCQVGKEVFYCKTCNWGNGDWFSSLQIAISHFIPRGFNMKKTQFVPVSGSAKRFARSHRSCVREPETGT